MSKILVVAEHDGEKLNSSTARAVSCALAIGSDIDVAVFAADGKAVCDSAAKLKGVKKVLRVARAENGKPLAAVLAPQIAKLAAGYSHVLAPSTTFGKDVLPRAEGEIGRAHV